MSDLKEETTVDNTTPAEPGTERKSRLADTGLEGLQLFYEKNKKMVNYVGGGLVVLIAAIVYFKLFYLPEQEKEAANEMFWAETFFEKDSFNIALKGGKMVFAAEGQKPMMGFEQVAEQYGLTKQGKLANYYAGICYLRTGNFEQAIEWLGKFNSNDAIVGPIALGATGDAHMELNHAEEALKFYLKAANSSNNNFTTPYFLKKASFASEMSGNFEEAANLYDRIRKEFPKSTEAVDAEKEVARLKAMAGK